MRAEWCNKRSVFREDESERGGDPRNRGTRTFEGIGDNQFDTHTELYPVQGD